MRIKQIYTMKYFALISFSILALACQSDGTNYNLKGTAKGFADGTSIFVYEIDNNNQAKIKDTLTITNSSFEASYPKVENTPLHFLKVEGTNSNIMFFVENEDLKATIYADSIGSSSVLGGRENELYTQFIAKSRDFVKQRLEITQAFQEAQQLQDNLLATDLQTQNLKLTAEEKEYKRNFVTENKNSLIGLMLLSEMFGSKDFNANEIKEVIGSLSPKMSEHPLVAELKVKMKTMNAAEIGVMAPDFEAPAPNGEMLALKDVLGKYTIIDFWASWCRPCRMENPNVVRVYEKYHEKGLNIISVSLDREGQKDRWLKAIEDDKMNWYHVSNLQFWQDPIARQYNVSAIPATFLLDENGKIIDKDLRGQQLEIRIAALLD